MSVAEVITFGVQKQLLNNRPESEGVNTASESDVSLRESVGDVVT